MVGLADNLNVRLLHLLYMHHIIAFTPAVPAVPVPPTPYPYGCFADTPNGRTMPVVLAWDKKDLTLEYCAALARAAGLRLYGVQFSWFCFGGNDLSLATSLGPSVECTMPCGGNSNQVRRKDACLIPCVPGRIRNVRTQTADRT